MIARIKRWWRSLFGPKEPEHLIFRTAISDRHAEVPALLKGRQE
jgi:hypothetical protein